MKNNRLTIFQEDDNNTLSDDLDIEQFTFSQPNLFSIKENTNQKQQKFLIFNSQHETTLGFIKLDGKIKNHNALQIQHKTISKHKQNNQDPLQCPICQKVFKSPQAVGGHSSRTHPNESKKYQSKVAKREERKYDLLRTRQLQGIVINDLELD